MNNIVRLRIFNALRELGYGPRRAWLKAMRY